MDEERYRARDRGPGERISLRQEIDGVSPLEPPVDVPEIRQGSWLTLPCREPVTDYVTRDIWRRPERPRAWEVTRLSSAAYAYRETSTGWTLVVKFYVVKTGSSAEKHAAREYDYLRSVRALGLADGRMRAVAPLSLWRGSVFLEYVPGLTLEHVISVRQGQPGRLIEAVEWAARFLARLHTLGLQRSEKPDFGRAVRYAHDVVDQLREHGVLSGYPITRDGLGRLIDRWAARPEMEQFVPCLTHGDTTTTNFIFPEAGGVVVLDWERFHSGDPAFDLGRLMAEITHSVNQHGGGVGEAEQLVDRLMNAYCRARRLSPGERLLGRARFYRASSTLRIARNGWISRLDRTALVAQAMALLAD